MPTLHWSAIVAGILISIVVTLVAHALLPPIAALVASLFGLAAGGFLAGKRGKQAPAYHGALVGVGFIVFEALGVIPGVGYVDPLADTLAIIALDAGALAASTLGGALSRVGSSSDRGRDR